ncbi:MAG TPA: DUF4257 domain-containing protein [Longimicrobium sp.]|nr:DUF4257 domain-containing protein [Longimicrobium sp.]
MKIPRPLALTAGMAAVPAVASMLWALPGAAQTDTTDSGTFNGTFDSAQLTRLLVIVLCGALGAFAADLVADGGRLDRWKKDGEGWTLGFLGKLIVGSVAAVILLSLNPPTNWWQLVGTALAAGVGGEAILLSIIASRKAEGAEKDREHAEATARGITALAQERLATLKAASVAETGGRALAAAAADAGGGRTVSLLADRFSMELRTFAAAAASAERKQVVITYRVPDTDFSQLLVDDVPISPDGEGIHRVLVGPGEHVLHCRAQTRPDVEYEVEITDPQEARWKPNPPRTADSSGVINDFMTFNING